MRGKKLILVTAGVVLAATLASAQAKKGREGDPAKGKEIFEQCAVCHNSDSTEKKMGPGLKGLFKKSKMSNGKPVNESTVRSVIDAGGNGMPPYKELLSEEEKRHLIAYLKTL